MRFKQFVLNEKKEISSADIEKKVAVAWNNYINKQNKERSL